MKVYGYHAAWLEAHPHRTAEWLREKLADGFDIHHADGDHSNNDPENLLLIETSDHQKLHRGTAPKPGFFKWDAIGRRRRQAEERMKWGRLAYEARKASPRTTWNDIAEEIGCPLSNIGMLAQAHAKRFGLQWPIADKRVIHKRPYAKRRRRLPHGVYEG